MRRKCNLCSIHFFSGIWQYRCRQYEHAAFHQGLCLRQGLQTVAAEGRGRELGETNNEHRPLPPSFAASVRSKCVITERVRSLLRPMLRKSDAPQPPAGAALLSPRNAPGLCKPLVALPAAFLRRSRQEPVSTQTTHRFLPSVFPGLAKFPDPDVSVERRPIQCLGGELAESGNRRSYAPRINFLEKVQLTHCSRTQLPRDSDALVSGFFFSTPLQPDPPQPRQPMAEAPPPAEPRLLRPLRPNIRAAGASLTCASARRRHASKRAAHLPYRSRLRQVCKHQRPWPRAG